MAVVGIGVLIAQRVKISSASQYVIKTGLGIKDISISKVSCCNVVHVVYLCYSRFLFS